MDRDSVRFTRARSAELGAGLFDRSDALNSACTSVLVGQTDRLGFQRRLRTDPSIIPSLFFLIATGRIVHKMKRLIGQDSPAVQVAPGALHRWSDIAWLTVRLAFTGMMTLLKATRYLICLLYTSDAADD